MTIASRDHCHVRLLYVEVRSRGCGIYLLIYLLVDEGIAKLRYLKSYSTDDQSHQFVLKCPKVSCTRYHLLYLIYSMGN